LWGHLTLLLSKCSVASQVVGLRYANRILVAAGRVHDGLPELGQLAVRLPVREDFAVVPVLNDLVFVHPGLALGPGNGLGKCISADDFSSAITNLRFVFQQEWCVFDALLDMQDD